MSQFRRILKVAKPFSKQIFIIAFFIIVLSATSQLEPFINKEVVDQVVKSFTQHDKGIPTLVIKLFGLLIIIRFLRVIVRRIINYFTNLFTYRFRYALREKGFSHLMNLSVNFFDEAISGELMSKLDRGTSRLTEVVNNSGLFFIPSVLTAIIGAGVISYLYWPIAVAMILMFIPFTLISLWRFNRNQKLEKEEYKLYDDQYGHFWEAVTSIRFIKSFIAENFEIRRLKEFNEKIFTLVKKRERNWNIATVADFFLETWIWFIYVVVISLGFKGQFTLGTIILLINYIDIIREPLWQLNWFFWEAKSAQLGARDYFKILDIKPEIVDSVLAKKLGEVNGKIIFDNVSFSYKYVDALKNINLVIEPKKTTALVGPSGSGKTTIVSLISRFYDPTKGRILLDNLNIKKVKQRSLRRNIGWVTQEPYLFADTILENLYYGNPSASLEKIKMAAKMAHADEFIEKLPLKYLATIGERGVQLSGGQKQRLALARVILKNPSILILDEATSALDSISEMLIQEALKEITRNRTTIIIAHRLSTARKADKIVVMDKGEIIETGNHEELLEKNGLYAKLHYIQANSKQKAKISDLID